LQFFIFLYNLKAEIVRAANLSEYLCIIKEEKQKLLDLIEAEIVRSANFHISV